MRVLFKAGSTITEITKEVEGFKSEAYSLSYSSGNALYIGSELPFNHFYVKLGDTVNAVSATMSIATHENDSFNSVVNKIDGTNALFESGFVDFTPDRDSPWERQSTNGSGESITELNTVTIYDLYWAKITFNQTLTTNVDLKWIGYKFSDDYDLFSEHPIFNDSSMMSVYESGKVDWEEQAVKAAEIVVRDLQAKKIIYQKEQILDRDVFKLAAVSKTAQLIYTAFGKDYVEKALAMKNEYENRMNIAFHRIDLNKDAVLNDFEKTATMNWLSR